MTNTGFDFTDWRVSDRLQRKSRAKQTIYRFLRPLLSANAARYLSQSFRDQIRPDAVYFTRGALEEWRRRWGARHVDLADSTILGQGTGTGWGALAWAEMKPRRLLLCRLRPALVRTRRRPLFRSGWVRKRL